MLTRPLIHEGSVEHLPEGAVCNRTVLEALTAQELVALERVVCVVAHQWDSANTAVSKRELHDAILVAIGLSLDIDASTGSAEKAKTLEEKVRLGMFDVFLAHNSQDKDQVMKLGVELRREGIYPWIDVEQIPPGRWFQDVLQSAARTVKTAAVIIGQSGLGRRQAIELRSFISRCVDEAVPLIPVLLPGAAALPENLLFLRELNWVGVENDVTERKGLENLIWGISGKTPTR